MKIREPRINAPVAFYFLAYIDFVVEVANYMCMLLFVKWPDRLVKDDILSQQCLQVEPFLFRWTKMPPCNCQGIVLSWLEVLTIVKLLL